MKPSSSILVVGGGEFGLTAALELRRRGHGVTLIDPGPLPHPDAASTDISKVIRADYGTEEFYMDMMEEAFADWEAWNAGWDRPLYHPTGVLFITSQAFQPGGFEYESHDRLRRRGYQLEPLDRRALVESFPAWRPTGEVAGYYNLRGGWAESGEVIIRFVQEARQAGVELREGLSFAGLLENGGRVNGAVTTGGADAAKLAAAGSRRSAARGESIAADCVVVAAGAWTPLLLPHLREVMRPVGQPVFHFRPPDPDSYRAKVFPVWALDIHSAGWYGFPLGGDEVVKVANHGQGLAADPSGERQVPASEEDRFRSFLRQALPGLAEAPVARTRLCFYCDTFDGDFFIGRDHQHENLVVCAGDSGHAFKFAPLLGSITADVVEGRPNRWKDHFAWRHPAVEMGAAPRK